MTPTAYVAGPMSGIPGFNFPLFDEVAAYLRDCDYTVFNPHENDLLHYPDIDLAVATATGDVAGLTAEIGFDLQKSMEWDLARVLDSNMIVMLPGWESSTGATAERFVAEMTGKDIFLADPDHPGGGIVIHPDPVQRRLAAPKVTSDGEVRVTDPATGGAKGTKAARFDLIPSDILWELAEHYGKGEAKYPSPDDGTGRMNWQLGYRWSLSTAALLRHLYLFLQGEEVDEETGSHHLIAVAWHAIALRWFQGHGVGTDDRVPTA